MKSMFRDRLRILQHYVKLGILADEFGLSRTSLSRFMKNENFDYCISETTLYQFINFIELKIKNIT